MPKRFFDMIFTRVRIWFGKIKLHLTADGSGVPYVESRSHGSTTRYFAFEDEAIASEYLQYIVGHAFVIEESFLGRYFKKYHVEPTNSCPRDLPVLYLIPLKNLEELQ